VRSRSIARVLRRLVDGDLAGIVGDNNIESSSALVVLDLSRVWGSDRFVLSALVATSFARRLVDDPRRAGYLVIDEAWAVIADESIAKWLAGSFKLSRSSATSHVLVLHRWSDAFAAAPEGSQRRARVTGLLRDCDTVTAFRQDRSEITLLESTLGLSALECRLLIEMPRGRALCRYALHRSLVQVEPTPLDLEVIDTDSAMRAFA
jgi:hypothetical protein